MTDSQEIPRLMERLLPLVEGTEWQGRFQLVVQEIFEPTGWEGRESGEKLGADEMKRVSYLIRFALEEFLTRRFGSNGEINFVDDFVRNLSGIESDYYFSLEFEMYELIRDSRLTIYEVVDTTRGGTTVLKDLIYGGENIAIEYSPTLSELVELWYCLAGRVIPFQDEPFLTPDFLPFDQKMAGNFLENLEKIVADKHQPTGLFRRKSKNAGSQTTREEILASLPMAKLMSEAWNDAMEQRGQFGIGIPPPIMGTVEGDFAQVCEVTFRVKGNFRTIANKLDRVDGLWRLEDENYKWNWGAPKRGLSDYLNALIQSNGRVSKDGRSAVNADNDEWLGVVELSFKKLKLWTPTERRAQAGEKLLRAALSRLISNPMLTYINSHEESKNIVNLSNSESKNISLPQVLIDLLNNFRYVYYSQAIDIPSQDYDRMSPREMALSSRNRRKALEWLKMRESTDRIISRNQQQEFYDFTWMWKELGFDRSE